MHYVALHLRLNTPSHCLTVVLFDEEEASEDKDHKTRNKSWWVRSWHQRARKKATITVFLKNFQ